MLEDNKKSPFDLAKLTKIGTKKPTLKKVGF
jgi:hypothetical protein